MRRGLSFGLGILVIMGALGGLSGTMLAHADRDLSVTPRPVAGSVQITGEYWAVIIGIDRYQHAPKLETAVRDAVAVRDVLIERYGFKRDRIIELLNDQATGRRIQNALFQLGRQAGPEDSIFIYYAGHGQYEDDGRIGWWVPVEAEPRDPGTFIMDVSILNYVRGMKAKHVYLVADSCFSGTLFGTRAMPPIDDQWFARLYKKPSRWGLTSGATEPVADKGKDGHSIFAYHFIKLLTENEEPYLVPSRIHDRVAPLVANNANQTPRSEPLKNAGDEGGQFVFRLAALSGGHVADPLAAQRQQLVEERQRLQAERAAMERQRQEAEARAKLEAERRQLEEERQRIAAEQQRAEQPRPIEEARVRPYESPKGSAESLVGQGMIFYSKGDLNGALASFSKAIEVNPGYAIAYTNRGLIRYKLGDVDGALADHSKAIGINPKLPEAYTNRGGARLAKGDVAGAIADHSEALKLNPKLTSAWSNRGLAYLRQRNLDSAMSDLNQALKLDPFDPEAYVNRAGVYLQKQEIPEAVKDASKAMLLNPKLAEAYNIRGAAYYYGGPTYYKQSLIDLDKALELNPRLALAYLNRGILRVETKDYAKGLQDLNKGLELAPNLRPMAVAWIKEAEEGLKSSSK